MSEKLPYEDDLNKQAGDLPLPDIDHSWQKMEAMLNEDKRRRTIIPYFRYAIWGLLCLAVAGGSWYFISTNTTKKDPTFSEAHQAQSDSQTSNTAAAGNSTKSDKELAGIENSTAKPQSNKTRESNITRDKAPDASIRQGLEGTL